MKCVYPNSGVIHSELFYSKACARPPCFPATTRLRPPVLGQPCRFFFAKFCFMCLLLVQHDRAKEAHKNKISIWVSPCEFWIVCFLCRLWHSSATPPPKDNTPQHTRLAVFVILVVPRTCQGNLSTPSCPEYLSVNSHLRSFLGYWPIEVFCTWSCQVTTSRGNIFKWFCFPAMIFFNTAWSTTKFPELSQFFRGFMCVGLLHRPLMTQGMNLYQVFLCCWSQLLWNPNHALVPTFEDPENVCFFLEEYTIGKKIKFRGILFFSPTIQCIQFFAEKKLNWN